MRSFSQCVMANMCAKRAGKSVDDVQRIARHHDRQAAKALTLAFNSKKGYSVELVSAINTILGPEITAPTTPQRWQTPTHGVHAAPRIATADNKSKSALARKFLSGNRSVAVFEWEERTLKALIVFYTSHTDVKNLDDNSEKATKICALADKLMGEPCLQPQFVEVSDSNDQQATECAL